MSQATTLTVNDRENTPVSHDFVPRGDDKNGVYSFVESTGVPIGDKVFTVSLRQIGDRIRARLILSDPVLVTETVNGVDKPVVPRTSYVDCTFTYSRFSSTQERKNLVGIFANLLDESVTTVDDTIVNLEGIF